MTSPSPIFKVRGSSSPASASPSPRPGVIPVVRVSSQGHESSVSLHSSNTNNNKNKNNCSSNVSASLAPVVRQLRLILEGGRREKTYRHHLFYRKCVCAAKKLTAFSQKRRRPRSNSRQEEKKQKDSPAVTRSPQPTAQAIPDNDTDDEQKEKKRFLAARYAVLDAGKAVAAEMTAARIDTVALCVGLFTQLAIADQVVSSLEGTYS